MKGRRYLNAIENLVEDLDFWPHPPVLAPMRRYQSFPATPTGTLQDPDAVAKRDPLPCFVLISDVATESVFKKLNEAFRFLDFAEQL